MIFETTSNSTDDAWWENLPDEITFSPASSFSYTSSASDLAKPPVHARHDELRPSVNDFLDLSDESKTNLVEETTPRRKENNTEQIKSPGRRPEKPLNTSPKIENNLRGEKVRPKMNEENFEVDDEVTPRNVASIPRLNLNENSQKFDEKSRKSPRDKNELKFKADSKHFDQNSTKNSQKFRTGYKKSSDQKSWKADRDERGQTFRDDFQDHVSWESDSEQNSKKIERDEHSEKFGTNSKNFPVNSRKSAKEYKPENFQSDIPLQGWQGGEKVGMDSKDREEAALTIQKFYRGYKTRMAEGYSAVQKALDERRAVMERQKKVMILKMILWHFT